MIHVSHDFVVGFFWGIGSIMGFNVVTWIFLFWRLFGTKAEKTATHESGQ